MKSEICISAIKFVLAATALFGCASAEAPDGTDRPLNALEPSVFAPGLISTGFDESHATYSPDGQTLYFLRNTPDFAHWTIFQSSFSNGSWSIPEVAPFSGRWNDADVFITKDGRHLFFISDRPAPGRSSGRTDTDLWMMEWKGHAWGEPLHLPELSSEGYEWFPTLTDEGVLYFGSERLGGAGASDIWRVRWTPKGFKQPENLGRAINTAEQEIEPLIAPDESYIIFAARRDGQSKGEYDLFISYNCPRGWSPPQPLPGNINSSGWDFSPRFDSQGMRFVFTSNRSTFATARQSHLTSQDLHRTLSSPGNGLRDIYEIDAGVLPLARSC